MESDPSSPTQESNELKAEFHKMTNEAATRKYRCHSPIFGSSDEEGSPKRDHSSREISKSCNNVRRDNDKGDDRSSTWSQHGRSSCSYRHSSRGNQHDEHSRYGKCADEDERRHTKSSVRSGREPRDGTNSDHREQESDYRSRDRYRDVDRYPSVRSRYDGRHGGRYDYCDRNSRDRDHYHNEKREYRNSKDHRGDQATSKKETSDLKDFESSKFRQEKGKNEGLDKQEEKFGRAGRFQERSGFVSEDSAAKRPKFSLGSADQKADEMQSSGFNQSEDLETEVSPQQGLVSVPNVDAAKVAAIKAAQLVNQNLTSTGFMTADQKKKLLWGNKKSNAKEESSHHWDTSLFSDRERQEKFHKLMGVKGEVKVDTKPLSSQDAEKQKELQMDLEKQYTAGLRRRDGRTVGLGL